MNIAYFIAKRYFKAKKSRNVINLITRISVIGIAVSTLALVIVISAFNGIEDMVIKLYSDFDPPLTVRSSKAKTFSQSFLDIEELQNLEGIKHVARAVEEVVILKHEDKWVHANMVGVDTNFLQLAHVSEHMVDGEPVLYDNNVPLALFGAGLLDKLDAYVSFRGEVREQVTFHVPLRDAKLRPGKKPLSVKRIPVAGRVNYNREVNEDKVVVPYSLAAELLQYGNDITAIYLDLEEDVSLEEMKDNVQSLLGKDFTVKTNFEKNELIFKTSKTERLIVVFILLFIFLLSSFNLIASLTMLFVEKKNDIDTIYSFGGDKKLIFKIFFFEGLMISGRGVIAGLLIGYLVVFAQINFVIIQMPGAVGEAFPMKPTAMDAFLILSLVSILGFLVSYLPTKYLVNKHSRLSR